MLFDLAKLVFASLNSRSVVRAISVSSICLKHGEIVRSSIWWYFYQFDCGVTWWNSTFRENQIDSKQLKSTQIDSNWLKSTWIGLNQFESIQRDSDWLRSINSNWSKSTQIYLNRLKSTQFSLNRIESGWIDSKRLG